jgi:hypothetical protein
VPTYRLGKYPLPAVQSPSVRRSPRVRGDNDSPARLVLCKLAGGIIRTLQECIGNNSEGEYYAPKIKEPRCTARSTAEQTAGRAIGARKFECLQKCEQAAA